MKAGRIRWNGQHKVITKIAVVELVVLRPSYRVKYLLLHLLTIVIEKRGEGKGSKVPENITLLLTRHVMGAGACEPLQHI